MMSELQSATCPVCHKELPAADLAFCPYCGSALHRQVEETPAEVRALLQKVEDAEDPVKKHKLLMEGREKYPDCLPIETEILFLGRLHERNPKKFDLSVIKCYLWHFYLTPGEFTEEKADAMRAELVAGEQLQRCLALAQDPDAYMRKYLERLAKEFIDLFLRGSNRYNRSLFGFKMESRYSKFLASPAANVMAHIYSDEKLEGNMRITCYDAFYRAFEADLRDTQFLDGHLEEMGLPKPIL